MVNGKKVATENGAHEGQSACVALLLAVLVLVLGVIASALLTGCAQQRPPVELPAPCDSLTLESVTTECWALVKAKCQRNKAGPLPSCPELKKCDARIDKWLACEGSKPVTVTP